MYVHTEQSMLGQPPSADGARRLWGWEHVELCLWTVHGGAGGLCAGAVTLSLTALPETESEAGP